MSYIDAGSVVFDKTLFTKFKYERLRLDRENQNLNFLLTCRRLDIIPAFLKNHNRLYNDNFTRLTRQFERKCLNLSIRKQFAYINSLQSHTFNLYSEFASATPPYIFDFCMKNLDRYRYGKCRTKELIQNKKINHLYYSQSKYARQDCQPVKFINLSHHTFTTDETKALERGPKFIFPRKPDIKSIIPELESIVQASDVNHREEIRSIMRYELGKFMKIPRKPIMEDFTTLKRLKLDPEIIVIQTDKSNRIAVLDTEDYKDKMLQCIKDMSCEIVIKNPLSRINSKVSELINKGKWPDYMKSIIKINNLAKIPTIIGRLKDHKENMPIRPIVNKQWAPTYYIEKAFVRLLKDLIPTSMFVIRSTEELIHKLDNIQLPDNFLMASLDIVSLYPSVDIHKATSIINEKIDLLQNLSIDVKITLKSALNLIVNNNFFMFNNKIYFQRNGAPMGSPISGLLAEFILQPLEESIHQNLTFTPHTWLRYVDDIFILWQHTEVLLNSFLKQINQQDNAIQFTLEKENEGTLPFLDVLLIKAQDSIKRTVFRKKINSNCTIPRDAQTPQKYKLSAFSFYVRRAFLVCSEVFLEEELNMIRTIALNNGYNRFIIDKIIDKYHKKTDISINSKSKFYAIQYYSGLYERLHWRLKRFNINIIAKPSNRLINVVCRRIDPAAPEQMSGVYEIPYIKTDGTINFYIGMTNRQFKVRKKEHIADLKYNRLTTALARLYNSQDIQLQFENSKIIYTSNLYFPSVIRESIEIFTRSESICNETASFVLPRIWQELIMNKSR